LLSLSVAGWATSPVRCEAQQKRLRDLRPGFQVTRPEPQVKSNERKEGTDCLSAEVLNHFSCTFAFTIPEKDH
jgi:hypothetical protein